ncbi:hypothetical protein HanXRQr2_Chr14g0620201 [Helianthus annuus]|uniref:Uncharacterized protein n=1 Tax=Helianthus annuus TaxID=4232 RepID=A0A9K3H4M0_HELAN|nr:hypothetical protein HanXRQr2_Chr14g0620201 [Helianthus annuus]
MHLFPLSIPFPLLSEWIIIVFFFFILLILCGIGTIDNFTGFLLL